MTRAWLQVAGYSTYLARLIKETERTDQQNYLSSLVSSQENYKDVSGQLDKAANDESKAAEAFQQYLELHQHLAQ